MEQEFKLYAVLDIDIMKRLTYGQPFHYHSEITLYFSGVSILFLLQVL